MLKKLDRSELAMMRLLYESSDGLTPYTLMQRSKLPGQMFMRIFTRLTARGLLTEKNSLIALSSEGKTEYLDNFVKIIPGSKVWREIPQKMKGRKIPLDDLYAPNINLMK